MDARAIVEATLTRLCESYVFAERAAAAAGELRERAATGRYDALAGERLCEALTADLHEVCPDQHLRMEWTAEPRRAPDPQRARLANYGLHRAERLAGNVGYLDLRRIDDAQESAPTLAAAMQLVAYTGALLLDLRRNTGGAPSGVAFLCSYFFPAEPVHVNDVYDGATRTVQQFWTYAHVPGPRYLDRPVWVLTSARTFSGGEELAYNLQQLRRATLVGETTRGGAHPTDSFPITDDIAIRVPVARSINPVSGTNWEGTGVVPDIAVEAGRAQPVAYAAALRAVLAGLGDPPARHAVHAEASRALADLGAAG